MKMIEIMQDEEGNIFVAKDGGEAMEMETVESVCEMIESELGGMGDDGMEMDDMTEEAQMNEAMAEKENEEFKGGFNSIRGAGL